MCFFVSLNHINVTVRHMRAIWGQAEISANETQCPARTQIAMDRLHALLHRHKRLRLLNPALLNTNDLSVSRLAVPFVMQVAPIQ